MAKDEFGIEVDEDVVKALGDPKAGVLTKVVDYLVSRREAQKAKEDKDEAAKKPTGVFGGLFS